MKNWQYWIGPLFFCASLVSGLLAFATFIYIFLLPFGILYLPFLHAVVYYFELLGIPIGGREYYANEEIAALIASVCNAFTVGTVLTYIGYRSLLESTKHEVTLVYARYVKSLLCISTVLLLAILPSVVAKKQATTNEANNVSKLNAITTTLKTKQGTQDRLTYCDTVEGTYFRFNKSNFYKDHCLHHAIFDYSISDADATAACKRMIADGRSDICLKQIKTRN